MKLFLSVALVASLIICAAADETYTSKFDSVDIDEILKSDRLFNNYYKCLTDEGKCTPDARELKKVLPDALQTKCSKCTPKQKEAGEKVLKFLAENKPTEWAALQKKYDPEGIYMKKYAKEAEEKGIKL